MSSFPGCICSLSIEIELYILKKNVHKNKQKLLLIKGVTVGWATVGPQEIFPFPLSLPLL